MVLIATKNHLRRNNEMVSSDNEHENELDEAISE